MDIYKTTFWLDQADMIDISAEISFRIMMFTIKGTAGYKVNDRKQVHTEQYSIYQYFKLGTETLDSTAEVDEGLLEAF